MSGTPDSYWTIAAPSEGDFRDRGSKFIAYAYPIKHATDVAERIQELKQLHPKARHHCYAYRIGLSGNNYRANDDGEPSSSAGRPILGQIDSASVTNVVVVVVRYFGGTKLGVPGLINAYKTSAALALEAATKEERYVKDVYELRFTYQNMSTIMQAVNQLGFETLEQDFADEPHMQIAMRQKDIAAAIKKLKAKVAGVYLEEVDTLEEIEDFELIYLSTI